MRLLLPVLVVPVSLFLSVAEAPPPAKDGSKGPTNPNYVHEGSGPVDAHKVHPCGPGDKVHKYDLHDEDGDSAMVPCSSDGDDAAGKAGHDFSGAIHIETVPEGVHITSTRRTTR